MSVDKKQYAVYGYMRRLAKDKIEIEPIVIYDIVVAYYRNPLLRQLIADAMRKRYSSEYVHHLIDYVMANDLGCKAIFKDITNYSMQCSIIDHFAKMDTKQPLNLLELHELLRNICVGSSKYSTGHVHILYNFSKFIISYIKPNGIDDGKKLDLHLVVDNIDNDKKLEMILFIYLFAYHWLYGMNERSNGRNRGNKSRNKRNKADVMVNACIQHLFKEVDVMEVPLDISKKLIMHENVNQSSYFVRNVLNQYMRNTFVPFTTQ